MIRSALSKKGCSQGKRERQFEHSPDRFLHRFQRPLDS
jgi:hypothetical protein